MILQPGEIRPLALQGRFLICRRVEGKITVSDPDNGIGETLLRQSDIAEFASSQRVYVKNTGAAAAVVELQSTAIPIRTSDGGAVMIAGGSIDRIRDSIQVTASATVENGTVTSLSVNQLGQSADIVINPGQTVTLLAANPTAKRRIVFLQNISASYTALRIGAAPTASAGLLLPGAIDAIGSLEMDTTGEIKAHNAGSTAATVAVMWGAR